MNIREWLAPATAVLIGVAQLTILGAAGSPTYAAPPAPGAPPARCEMHLRVELTPDVLNPSDAGLLSSLLHDHPAYRLTLQGQDLENASVIMVELTGPGPGAGCQAVVEAVRKDARVWSVDMLPAATA